MSTHKDVTNQFLALFILCSNDVGGGLLDSLLPASNAQATAKITQMSDAQSRDAC